MSNNITNLNVITCNLTIPLFELRSYYDEYQQDLCESTFVEDLVYHNKCIHEDIIIKIENPIWGGVGSGRCYKELEKILSLCSGFAEMVYTYQSGDLLGLRVKDKVVSQHNVKFMLED